MNWWVPQTGHPDKKWFSIPILPNKLKRIFSRKTVKPFYPSDLFNKIPVDFSAFQKMRVSLHLEREFDFKVVLSPSKKNCVICLIESPLKMMKNVFYFILKVLFILKIFTFFPRPFGHVRKTAWLER